VFQRSNARRRIAQAALAVALLAPALGISASSAFAGPAVAAAAAPGSEVSQMATTAVEALSALKGWDGQVITAESFLDQAVDYSKTTAIPGAPSIDAWTAVSVTPYVAQLARLSVYVAEHAGVSSQELLAVWVKTDSRRMVAVLTALAQLGTPYRTRGDAPGGFDCSGLFGYSWEQAGVSVPRSSGAIIHSAHAVTRAQLLPGDVVWRPGHVQMYLGVGDATVHSPRTGKTVEVTNWGRVSRFGSPI
jgi:cell wall-associated NlpC family hydrolase